MERAGRYTLLEPLGAGGMARVFLAQKDGSSEICVLKRLHGPLESNPLVAKRFHREAHIASLLSHRAIARVLDAGIEDSSFCIAMELIAGQTLEAILAALAQEKRSMPLPIALRVAVETLEALAYAHDFRAEDDKALNIVHRDLTPRNIMISYAGLVKIIDFGIARGDVDELKTAPGTLMGTPYYMSPEQARTLPVDRRSDLYTFAAVFFELLAGQRLVRATGRAAILAEVAATPAPLLSSIAPNAPPGFDAVLARALDKDPARRHANAAELLADLLRAAGGASIATFDELALLMRRLFPDAEAKLASLSRSGEVQLETTRAEVTTSPPPRRARSSQPILLAMAAGIILPIALGGIYFMVADPEPLETRALDPIPTPIRETPRVVAKPAPDPVLVIKNPQPPLRPPVKRAENKVVVNVEAPAEKPSRTAELEEMLAALRAAPKDTKLRTLLYDRLAAESEKLPAQKQRRIKAAIDRALLDEDISGLEHGVREIKKAIDAGEMP
jgi:serine/threonine protein kinase